MVDEVGDDVLETVGDVKPGEDRGDSGVVPSLGETKLTVREADEEYQ